jgi:hypothetical protein
MNAAGLFPLLRNFNHFFNRMVNHL